MSSIKAIFKNAQGEKLAGLLQMPAGQVASFAVFAHCFSGSKDISAASEITRTLSKKDIAVLRFDFTGLGNSEGDFANTNFSSNIADLICAAEFLAENYQAPELLVGHSLGGAAVLAAAQSLPSVRALVTIGAPATAQHIEHLFLDIKEDILETGYANVDLAGRQFTIKRQFLEDISHYNDIKHIGRLGRALLIFHSPIDKVVSINEAAKIYTAARHPKSFISLDDADHLLMRRSDSIYVASIIGQWVARYLQN